MYTEYEPHQMLVGYMDCYWLSDCCHAGNTAVAIATIARVKFLPVPVA